MLQFNKEGEKMKINEELFDYFKQVGTIKHYQKMRLFICKMIVPMSYVLF